MRRPVPLDKLSGLQRLVLVLLLEERYSMLKRREFRDLVKGLYWGQTHALAKGPSVAVSLSRALSRLEERGFIVRFTHGGWRLTYPAVTGSVSDLVNNGEMFAILAWKEKKDLYAQLGLRGPTLESLGVGASESPARAKEKRCRGQPPVLAESFFRALPGTLSTLFSSNLLRVRLSVARLLSFPGFAPFVRVQLSAAPFVLCSPLPPLLRAQ